MPVSLTYGLDEEEKKGISLDYGLEEVPSPRETTIGVPLDYGLEEKETLPGRVKEPEKIPWSTRYPTLYGLYGAALSIAELGKFGFPKYADPYEIREFQKLSPQEQKRQLLMDTAETLALVGGEALMQKLGVAAEVYIPTIYKWLTKPRRLWPAAVKQTFKKAETIVKPPTKPKAITEPKPEPIAKAPEQAKVGDVLEAISPEGKKITVKKEADIAREIPGDPYFDSTKQADSLYRIIEGPGKGEAIPGIKLSSLTAKAKLKIPTGEPLPKYAQSVNLEKQSISESAKRLEMEMAGPKKYQSWDKTEQLGNKILDDINKTNKLLKKAKRGEGITTAESHAIRQTNVNAIDRLSKMSKEYQAGQMTDVEFQREFQLMRDDVFRVTSDASSEIGRALNYHKKTLSVTDHMAKNFAKLEKNLSKIQIEQLSKINLENPLEVANFLNTLEDPRVIDYVTEFWYNAILSGPPTHVINAATNTAWSLYQIPHRIHTAFWDNVYTTFTGKARTRYVNEVIPMMAGYKSGFIRGARGYGAMMKTGQIQEFETKWAQEIGYKALEAWARSPNAFMRKLSRAVSAPTREMRAADVWANSISYDGEINSIARGLANKKALTGTARKTFEKEFKKDLPEWAHKQAMKTAKHSTFMDDPDKFTSWVLGLRRVPVIGAGSRFVMPFVNTIGNLLKRGLEFTPGAGIAKEAISRQMGRGLGTPEVIAKQIEGSILSLYIMYKYDLGEITGAPPTSEAEREAFYRQGKKPWSIRYGGKENPETGEIEGGTWIQYRRMEPFNTAIAMVTVAKDAIENAKDEATATEIFGQAARGMVNNLIDSSYFQGMQQIFNRHEKFKTAPSRMAASFVPYSSFWRSINRAVEKVTGGEAKVRERGWLQSLSQVIPGLSGKVPARLDVWGEEKVIPGSVFQHWLPWKWVQEKADPVEKALATLERYPALPSQYVTIKKEKVKLDDDIYRKMCIDFGHSAKARLMKFIDTPTRQKQLKDETKHPRLLARIDEKLNQERNKARRKAIREQRKLKK